MLPSIALTQFYPPAPKLGLIRRARLVEAIDRGIDGKLTLVCAPAGSGKTVLLVDWIRSRGLRTVWISVDPLMSEAATFLSSLIGGIRTAEAEIGSGLLEGLHAQFPVNAPAIVDALVNELAAGDERLVVVLDDFHRAEGPAVPPIVARFVERMPSRVHLVLATREDPPFPLAKLRVSGELNELRQVDLRFTRHDAESFLKIAFPHLALGEWVSTLVSKTEGWATGIQLAALSLKGHENADEFVRTFAGSNRFVLDYLIEEVLRTLSDDDLRFLWSSSIFDRFCAELCDSVLERHGSAEVLARFEHSNLFVVPLDDERRWYRYHHLFAEALALRRSATIDSQALHRRASDWFAHRAMGADAFRHAVAASDDDRAAALVEAELIPSYDRATVANVLEWLSKLPRDRLESRPTLRLRIATMRLLAGQTAEVDEHAQAAETTIASLGLPDRDDLLGQAACARATVAVTQYRASDVVVHAQRALSLLNRTNSAYRFMASSALAYAQLLGGEREDAARSYREALVLAEASGDRFSIAMATTNLGQVRELDAQAQAAVQAYRRVLDILGPNPQPYACEATLGLARLSYWRNELDEAESLARSALELALRYDPAIDRFVLAEILLAQILAANGEIAKADQALQLTAKTIREREFVHRWGDWAEVRLGVALKLGRTEEAEELVRSYPSPWASLRLSLALDKPEALDEARNLLDLARSRRWGFETIRATLYLACAQVRSSDQSAASKSLEECRGLAGDDYPRLFLDERELLAALVRPSFAPGLGPLSARELEVLRLVAQGLSNDAIADRLFVALDTVKGHNRRIFEKLGVSRRTEAVAAALRLGLLDAP